MCPLNFSCRHSLSLLEATTADPYEVHFGPNTQIISETKRTAVEERTWKTSKGVLGKLGNVVEYSAEESSGVTPLPPVAVSKDTSSLENTSHVMP